MKKNVNIGVIGFGTVGSGVVKLMQRRAAIIRERVGAEVKLTRICEKKYSPRPGIKVDPRFITGDWQTIVNDPEIDIVVELIGGYEPAHTIILSALSAGKHVVTANKAVLAKHWDEIFGLARKNGKLVYFEASVGAGIPVIQGLNEGLAANLTKRIVGILNGTTNFILSNMDRQSLSFDEALLHAQKLGFAESDATHDLDGLDAANKLAILASIATGTWIKIGDVYREGITHITREDITFARDRLGLVVKLLGIANIDHKTLDIRVHPVLLPKTHPFAAVTNEYNAILIQGDAAGDVIFYGRGAGQMSAASAVVSDIIFLARQVYGGTAGLFPYVSSETNRKFKITPVKENYGRYYLRFTTVDKPGVLAKIAGVLGNHNVSIASVFQAQEQTVKIKGKACVPVVIVTHKAKEGMITDSLRVIDRLPLVIPPSCMLRIDY